jgi:hypothetical protein
LCLVDKFFYSFVTYQLVSKAYILLREQRANLNTRMYLAIFLIATSIAVAALSITPAFADRSSAQDGLDNADSKIHEHAPPQADEGFHKGTCSGGFSAGGFPC